MTIRQESKLSMYLAVLDYLTANSSIVNPLPNYSGYFRTFQDSITQIQTYAEQQMFDKKGISLSKQQIRENLVALAADTSRRLTAYAKFANNQVLLAEIKFTDSALKRGADTLLRDYAQGLYDRAQSNLPALADYGITAATQTALQNEIASFVHSIPKPRLGITEKKQSTIQLATNFDVADDALNNIDTIIDIVKVAQANFYNGYKNARKIVLTGTNSLTLKGFVTDAATGEPIKGVTLNFCPECAEPTQKAAANGMSAAKEEIALTKKTAEKGGFNIKSLPEGVYRVTVKKNGYQEQVVTVTVNDGELGDLNVELLKN